MTMTNEIHVRCFPKDDKEFRFSVTSHEGTDDSISIHGFGLGATFQCSVDRAKNLIAKLQRAIRRIEEKEGTDEG